MFEAKSKENENENMAFPNNESMVNFINVYKNLGELWDVTSPNYKNKSLKKNGYDQLKNEYKNIDANASGDVIKNKIKNMRTAYRRELKKKLQSEKSGAGFDEIYQPSLWYFDALDFLRDFEKPEPGVSTVLSSDDDCAPKTDKRENDTETSTSSVNKKRNFPNHERNELLRKATKHIENLSSEKEPDEADIYAKGWAISYRKLSVEQKLFAKKACDEIFVLGQLNKLTLNSVQSQSVQRPISQIINLSDISNSRSSPSTSTQIHQSPFPQVIHVVDADGRNRSQYSSFQDLFSDAEYN